MSIYTQPYSWKEVRIEITAAQTWAGWASSPESRGKRPGQPQRLAAGVCWVRGTRGGGPAPSERGSGLGACCATLHLLSQPSNSRHWVLF